IVDLAGFGQGSAAGEQCHAQQAGKTGAGCALHGTFPRSVLGRLTAVLLCSMPVSASMADRFNQKYGAVISLLAPVGARGCLALTGWYAGSILPAQESHWRFARNAPGPARGRTHCTAPPRLPESLPGGIAAPARDRHTGMPGARRRRCAPDEWRWAVWRRYHRASER